MKSTIWIWELWGFAFTSLFGTLLHFLYDLLGNAAWVAPFSGVNESTFEHMKLLFWPMFIYAVFQSFFFKGYENFWCVKLRGALLGLALIPTVFYLYNGIIGKSPDFVNIAIFFVCAAVSYVFETVHLEKGDLSCKNPKRAFFALCFLGLLFVIFTFIPPQLAIFKDPIDGSYGIK